MSHTHHPAAGHTVDRDMLEDYLNQHLLGSRPGVPAFRAATQTWKDTPHEEDLRRITEGLKYSQDQLKLLIRRLGFRTPVLEQAAGVVAAAGGRANPVNALRTRGSGWTQVELDVLAGALQGQAEMWRVLERLAPHVPGLDATAMRAAHQRILGFIRQLQDLTDATLQERFLG